MKSWPCVYECGNPVSELGAYAKVSGTKYAHLNCHCDRVAERAVAAYLSVQADIKAQKEYAQQAAQDAAKLESEKLLQATYDRGMPNKQWLTPDRQSLVAAKWICVHCGKRINIPGEPGSGAEGKHCRACYVASQYGEQAAAQGAAKSAQGIAAVGEALKEMGKEMVKPKEEPKKQEEAKKSDRFELIDLE